MTKMWLRLKGTLSTKTKSIIAAKNPRADYFLRTIDKRLWFAHSVNTYMWIKMQMVTFKLPLGVTLSEERG